MLVNVEKLREDLKAELCAAFFNLGNGAAMVESFEIDKLSDEALIEFAMANGVNLAEYTERY